MSEVERFEGNIKTQTKPTGIIIGRKAFLKSLTSSCFIDRIRAIYIIKANLAKSEVWIVIPIPGKVSHRDAELIAVPITIVNPSSGIEIISSNWANLE
jgi:hypothetical protein